MFDTQMNDGMQLKNIGIQLQLLGSQIQNMGMQISYINNNYAVLLKNMGMQISNFSTQIFNIGIKMSNINLIQQPNFVQMNDIMNNMNINMNNFNEPLVNNIINNNNINNINEDYDESIIFILFDKKNGLKTTINISNKKSISELLNMYRKKIGENYEFFQRNRFLLNGREINPNETKSILEYGFKSGDIIFVIEHSLYL